MEMNVPQGPFCQSCGMPLRKPEDFGTDAGGLKTNDYCRFCFQGGSFTEPKINMQEMIEKCARIMSERGVMPEQDAKSLMAGVLPRLKRWQRG